MNIIDHRNNYPLLYHYTGYAGVIGILESQSLHATHFRYLNDYSEMRVLPPKIYQLLDDTPESSTINIQHSKIRSLLSEFVDGSDDSSPIFEPHVVSFCGYDPRKTSKYDLENGLLSQWRAYGRDGSYMLVFDTCKLLDLFRSEISKYYYINPKFESVFYDNRDGDFRTRFPKLIETWVEFQQKHKKGSGDTKPAKNLFRELMSTMSLYKHEGFYEEREVRMVLAPIDETRRERQDGKGDIKARKCRDSKSTYISIGNDCGENGKLPIKEIVVGPQSDQYFRQAELEIFLADKQYPIPVRSSKTPFI